MNVSVVMNCTSDSIFRNNTSLPTSFSTKAGGKEESVSLLNDPVPSLNPQ